MGIGTGEGSCFPGTCCNSEVKSSAQRWPTKVQGAAACCPLRIVVTLASCRVGICGLGEKHRETVTYITKEWEKRSPFVTLSRIREWSLILSPVATATHPVDNSHLKRSSHKECYISPMEKECSVQMGNKWEYYASKPWEKNYRLHQI